MFVYINIKIKYVYRYVYVGTLYIYIERCIYRCIDMYIYIYTHASLLFGCSDSPGLL